MNDVNWMTNTAPPETRESRLASENHALRAKLVEYERDIERRERVLSKLVIRIVDLEDALEAALAKSANDTGVDHA